MRVVMDNKKPPLSERSIMLLPPLLPSAYLVDRQSSRTHSKRDTAYLQQVYLDTERYSLPLRVCQRLCSGLRSICRSLSFDSRYIALTDSR